MRHKCSTLAWRVSAAFLAIAWMLTTSFTARAQLEVTEILRNPLSPNDNVWEWIEVRNLGGSPVDLDGAYAARVGDAPLSFPVVDGTMATNTVIPAGGIAVLYDANLGTGNPSNFNDQQFRDAWGLGGPGAVPLIGVSTFPALTNAGTAFGFWADFAAYNSDISDPGTGPEVTSLANTLFRLDYTTGNGFPSDSSGVSMRWSGNGSYEVGSNWATTGAGETGVVTSLEVSVAGTTNSADDIGSPGFVPAGSRAAGLLITEIMYNPDSPEDDWEWVEIYNNTGATIDFGATNYVIDDNDNAALAGANITAGTVADDAVAVLYNSGDITLQNMIDAWDPGGANGTNFIAVTGNWTGGFANGGDTVAIWDDFSTDYLGEATTGPMRTTANAVSVVDYDNDGVIWPFDDGEGSVFLADLSLDQNVGSNWLVSSGLDPLSFNAVGLPGTVVVHPGGDVGSPGTFDALAPTDADFDDDGDVDANDLAIWQLAFGGAATGTTGDAGSDGDADGGDFLDWQRQFTGPAGLGASQVPEPSSIGLLGLALALSVSRRRR